ncbi:MAG: O-antigen polymerase, partial [Terracidiphilus sp.]
MNLDALIVVLTLLVIVNYRFCRSVLYPPVLFCGMWLFVAVILRLNLVNMYPLHTITTSYIAVGATLFSAGGRIAFLVPRSFIAIRFRLFSTRVGCDPDRRRSKGLAKWKDLLVVVLLLAALGIQLHLVTDLASKGSGGGLLASSESTEVEYENNGTAPLLLTLDIPLLTVYFAILFCQDRKGRMAWVVVSIVLFICILRGSRGALLILVSALTCIYLIDKKQERILTALKATRWASIFFIALFGGLMVVKKGAPGSQASMISFATTAMVQYLVGPLGALDSVLMHPHDYIGLPNHTFKLFLKAASGLGLISYTPPPALGDWTFVPFGTNVSTLYKPFITDFSIYMALVAVTVIAFTQTLIYRRAEIGSRLDRYMFALTIYPLLMVTFDDVYTAFPYYIKGFI